MTDLREVLQPYVDSGALPGAVALIARGEEVDVRAVGSVDLAGGPPMARESVFRLASLTKPVVAAAVMTLVDEGRLALTDPVRRWLPELASPMVVRTPMSELDDVVPADRPITVLDVLTSRSGHGFPADLSAPAAAPLFEELMQGLRPADVPPPDAWMAALARMPLLHQPGEGWLYNTSSDIQGVLVARVSGQPLPEFLAERLFEPLGMVDTGFHVPADRLDRFTSFYHAPPGGAGLTLVDAPDGQWSTPPAFPSGAGGLVSTVDDWLAFGRMLLAGGTTADGRRVLSAEAVRLMTTDQLTPAQRTAAGFYTAGQGWGFGGSVDVEAVEPWQVPGRYGWLGGTGTAAHVVPATGAVALLFTQVQAGPASSAVQRDFWRYAATAGAA